MPEITPDLLAVLALVAFAAGLIDSIAGGGGLLTVPALLLAGLSPVQAIATNKLQGVFGAGTAALSYAASGQVDLRRQARLAMLAFAAGGGGALLAGQVPAEIFRAAMPLLLAAVAVFFLLKPDLGDLDRKPRLAPATLAATAIPLIGFYDGLFGPGAGSFYMLAFVTLAGYGMLKATAHTKLLNFASNLGGFAVFATGGSMVWSVGLAMCVGQIAGARLGSVLAMRVGAKLIRPLLVVTCLALAARLAFDAQSPLRHWLAG